MRKVFKSFEQLDVNTRAGVIISPTTRGLKIETKTAYNGELEFTYFITETAEYNKDTEWNKVINDFGTKVYDCLLEDIKNDKIKPYRNFIRVK